MSWEWKEDYLDPLLVPLGLLIIFTYHIFLLYKYLKSPLTTVLGCEEHYKKTWVQRVMQLDGRDKGTSVAVINSNITAATSLSSISLVLSSLIGAWVGSSKEATIFVSSIIYGDSRPIVVSMKYTAILTCFLIAFTAFIQTTRNYTLAVFLITIPNCEIPVSYVQKPFIRASRYHMMGMRVLYVAITLIMWIFGPIPMFVSSITLVATLYILDRNSTPPYQFQQHPNHTHLHKMGGEIALVTGALGHQGRANVN